MNNTGGLKKNLLVILNDNKMSICPRVGGLAEYLDRLRMDPLLHRAESRGPEAADSVPVIGDPVERFLAQVKDAIKAGMLGGMLFEELGFRYIGPVDGHNIRQLQKYLGHGPASSTARCCCTWSPRRGTASSRPSRTR